MRIRSNQGVDAPRFLHINLKVFGPLVSGVKGLGKVLLKSAGQAVLPKSVLSMRKNPSLVPNVSKQFSEAGLSAASADSIAVLEDELRELRVSSEASEEFPPEAKALEQHVLGDVKRWHVELFKQHDLTAGPITSHLKEEKAQSLYSELIESNDFAKANPDVLEGLIKHVVGMPPAWQSFYDYDSRSIVPPFDGGYLKATQEEKADPNSGLPFSLVKTTTGKVYELLNTLTSEAAQALEKQHGLHKRDPKVILGAGTYGKVRLARDVTTQEIVAVKKFVGNRAIAEAEEELALIKLAQARVGRKNPSAQSTLSRVLGHAHAQKSYLFMPLFNRGDGGQALAELRALRALRHDPMKKAEADTRFLHIAKGYAEAVKNLHDLGLVHRDIKLGNFMHSNNANGVEQTTLIDFGFAGDQRSTTMKYQSGTSMYMPPEVQFKTGPANKDQYDATQMDSYSLGMVLLELLKGAYLYKVPLSLNLKTNDGILTPFELKARKKSFTYYQGLCSAGVPSELLQNLAPDHAENLIAQLLAANPEDRMTAAQAFEVLTRWTELRSKATEMLASTSLAPEKTKKTVSWADPHGGTFMSKTPFPNEIQPEVSQPTNPGQDPAPAAKSKRSLYQKFFAHRKQR